MTQTAEKVSVKVPATERRSVILALSAGFVLLADISIVNIAAPSIQRQLGASISEVQLMVAGYQVAYAATLITGGRLGDIFGRRMLFLVGTASFALASLACGLAPSAGALIGSRIWQGASAALLYPQVISILRIAVPPQRQAKTFAAFGAVISCATIGGPVIAGVLISLNLVGGWRPIFLINVPIAMVLLAFAPKLVPTFRNPHAKRLDVLGALLVAGALCALTAPLTVGREHGWPLWTWFSFAATPLLVIAFLVQQAMLERGGKNPLVAPRLWGDPGLRTGLLLYVVFFAGVVSFFLHYSIVLQYGLGYGALAAGMAMVPYAIGSTLTSILSSRMVLKHGEKKVILVGTSICAAGSASMLVPCRAVPQGHSLALWMTPSMFVTGLGLGLVVAPLLGFVLANTRVADAGVVSGLLSTAQQIGGALGVALVGMAFFRNLPGGIARAGFPALRDGFTAAIIVVSAFFAATGIIVAMSSRRRDHAPHVE